MDLVRFLRSVLSTNPKRFMDPPPRHNTALFPLIVFSVSNAFSPKYKSLGNVNLAITTSPFTWMTEIELILIYLNIRFQSIVSLQIHSTLLLKFYQCFLATFFHLFICINSKKNLVQLQDPFSLLYILIYVHGLLNIPLIHVFLTYMLGILRIHHPSLHYSMLKFHFLRYQKHLICQPSPMSVSCQSTSVV